MALTLDEVLRGLPRAPATVKVAGAEGGRPATYAAATRKLAALIREIPEPEVSWARGGGGLRYRNPPPPLAQVSMDAEDARPGAPLRKIAQLLRTQEDARAVHLFEKSATALKAIRGLTLLRERVTR
jgi:hypothetical protein